jgi:hypothetical protein
VLQDPAHIWVWEGTYRPTCLLSNLLGSDGNADEGGLDFLLAQRPQAATDAFSGEHLSGSEFRQ